MKNGTEIVFFYLYDTGRSIDLKRVATMVPAIPDVDIIKNKRDTPQSLMLPAPLILGLGRHEGEAGDSFESITLNARIFEEGVISLWARVRGKYSPKELYRIRTMTFTIDGKETNIESWVDESLKSLFASIQEAITFEQYVFSTFVRETYTAFCLTSPLRDPERFVEANRRTIACLLNGESPETNLHASQIESTMRSTFSYTDRDYIVLDLDRCLIIDPDKNYEDILVVVEQAVFQLVELRSLDMLLDRWLDKAEDDAKITFKKNTARLKLIKIRLASIQALSFDALFILENLENSSKIIGDYFLCQIFNDLCRQFNMDGWKSSIERRLTTLRSIYDRVNADASERRMVFLEVMFIVVCIVFPLLQIIQVFFME